MWLDRLHSAPSASSPPPATRSSAPRRPSHLAPSSAPQRPGFNPRSSSLSLASNESTTSLLASSRRPNGSGLKQSNLGPEPLDVLENLLGPEGKTLKDSSRAVNGPDPADQFDFELDFEGLSLRQLATQGTSDPKLESVQNTQSIEECMYAVLQTLK